MTTYLQGMMIMALLGVLAMSVLGCILLVRHHLDQEMRSSLRKWLPLPCRMQKKLGDAADGVGEVLYWLVSPLMVCALVGTALFFVLLLI